MSVNSKTADAGKPRPSRGAVWLAVGLAVVMVAGAVAWFVFPVEMWLSTVRDWSMANPVTGALIFVAVYVLATVSITPCTPLSLLGGFAFGFAFGLPLVVIAALIGAAAAFWVARTALRERVEALVETRPRLKAVDEAVCEAGWRVVVLLRLSPVVPFNLQNYFYGVTDIPFRSYFLASAAGILPGSAVYVYLGATAGLAVSGSEMMPAEWALLIAGLLATVAACGMIGVLARRHLEAALGDAADA